MMEMRMPRDWLHDPRGRSRDADPRRPDPSRPELSSPAHRDDFGQADFSTGYVYDEDRRTAYKAADVEPPRDDFGQADYSDDYAYDPRRGHGYRRFAGDDRSAPDPRLDDSIRSRVEPRGWTDAHRSADARPVEARSGEFLGARDDPQSRRRRGPSDRVLWTVIAERLEAERGLDLRDLEVIVDDAEVTLNGTVRRKEDKRRIEDIADIDGVRHVQNNLRVRDGGRRWFG
jgi:hypothetical protein